MSSTYILIIVSSLDVSSLAVNGVSPSPHHVGNYIALPATLFYYSY